MNKPNILWICTDQQRYDSLQCYGNKKIDTPNIDMLAKNGVLFNKVYCQSPVCSPSRASFLTGRYPRTCRVRQNGQRIPKDEVLVSKLFANAGYTAGLVGKLHISPCNTSVCNSIEERIDDGYSAFHWSHHPDFAGKQSNWPLNEYNMWLSEKGVQYNRVPFQGSPYVFSGPSIEHSHSAWCVDESIKFINSHANYPEKPWFLSVNFYDPHHDFDSCTELLEKYFARLSNEDLPNYTHNELENKPKCQQKDHEGAYDTKGNFAYTKMDDKQHLLIKASYYAMVEQIDIQVGKLVDTLKKNNQYDNTIIIFTSDHGEMLGDHGIYLKGPYFYEPMVKVPLIMSWQNHITTNQKRKALIELVDIAPTLLHLAGLDECELMQGKSFHKLLSDTNEDYHRDSVYCEYYNCMIRGQSDSVFATMIANERYKLNVLHSSKEAELYDLMLDPREQNNLYYNSDYSQVRTEMLELMVNRMAFTADPSPTREAAY